ncbi:hypothetical protein ZWY2020_003175 [Hordeum vulgare]|nr:hypothetical protein ZWY2020_003175 [Hordeum vulgare]
MELGLASHAVLAVEDSRSLVSPGALLVIDLPGCFSPQMVPTWPDRFKCQVLLQFVSLHASAALFRVLKSLLVLPLIEHVLASPLHPDWVGFSPDEVDILKGLH